TAPRGRSQVPGPFAEPHALRAGHRRERGCDYGSQILPPGASLFFHAAAEPSCFFSDFSPRPLLDGVTVALYPCWDTTQGDSTMQIHAAAPLFAWGELEDCPTLQNLRDFVYTVPDPRLLHGLRAAPGTSRR